MNRILTKEEIKPTHDLTVGKLRRFLDESNLPDDAPVLVERVKDVYFEKHKWGVYLVEGFWWYTMNERNVDIANEKYDDKEQYPDITESDLKPATEEELNEAKDQYIPSWDCFKYDDMLCIRLHY